MATIILCLLDNSIFFFSPSSKTYFIFNLDAFFNNVLSSSFFDVLFNLSNFLYSVLLRILDDELDLLNVPIFNN